MKKLKLVSTRHPNDKTRERIKNMCVSLIAPDEIASALNMSKEELYENYSYEMQNSRTLVTESLVNMLMVKAENGDMTAAKFILQRQPAWRYHVKEQINLEINDACLKEKSAAHQNPAFQPLKLMK